MVQSNKLVEINNNISVKVVKKSLKLIFFNEIEKKTIEQKLLNVLNNECHI